MKTLQETLIRSLTHTFTQTHIYLATEMAIDEKVFTQQTTNNNAIQNEEEEEETKK